MGDAKPLLTVRQLEVLELVAKGLTNREIAGVLGIGVGTARNHVSAVIEALDVSNRTEAAVALRELGLGAGASGAPGGAPDVRFTVPGFGVRPALAVLPFDCFGDDPDLAILADGLVEELTTRLACYRWFPIIARNSAFLYKGRRVDVREVSRELGARYVVEGSVRPLSGRLRVAVQVIDGTSGEHVFADRYDWDREELTCRHDDVVDAIVGRLDPAISRIERLRVVRAAARDPGAWELLHHGMFRLYRETRGDMAEAELLFSRALERDPNFAPALAGLAQVWCFRLAYGWADAPLEAVSNAFRAARAAALADPSDPVSHGTLGLISFFARQMEQAGAAFECAIELNPSYAVAHWGLAAARLDAGRAEEAAELLRTAIRLSPRDPVLHHEWSYLGLVHLALGDPAQALACAEESLHLRADQPYAHVLAAACCGLLDRPGEGRAALAAAQREEPEFRRENVLPFLPAALAAALTDGWKRLD
jgi:TolB-like protein/DNA-binding CsgD family transcriptional regulator